MSRKIFWFFALWPVFAWGANTHRIVNSEQLQIPSAANEIYLLTEVGRPKDQVGYLLSHSINGKIFGQKTLTPKLYQELKKAYDLLPTTTKFGCRETVRRTSFAKGQTRQMIACLDEPKSVGNFDHLTGQMKELLSLQPVRLPAGTKLRK